MNQTIARCAPVVVGVLARAPGAVPPDADYGMAAGSLILQVAERACAEQWPEPDFERKARLAAMECIAASVEEPLRTGCLHNLPAGSVVLREELARALESLGPVRLQILALLLQEGLSITETAQVIGLPRWRVEDECAQVALELRQQLTCSGCTAPTH
jgi:DNA-directed RNA polymerase specialized sigma24 family protein